MSDAQDWDPRICNDRSGFLFQHDCDRLPEAQCVECGRPVCEPHTHFLDNEPYCTVCAKRDHKRRRKEAGRQQASHDKDYDDPYFYGDSCYRGYGRHHQGLWGFGYYHHYGSHDFTSGDAENLLQEGDGDFETDMSES